MSHIFQFIGNNFEAILYIQISLIILILGTFAALRVTAVVNDAFTSTGRLKLLFIVVFFSQFLLIGYFYWANYHLSGLNLESAKTINENTSWVRERLTIYFIRDNSLIAKDIINQHENVILTREEGIEEYHFSPNGKYILIGTSSQIYLYNIKNGIVEQIDSVEQDRLNNKAVISGIAWAPDSVKFCYEVSRWSDVSSQDNVFVYNIKNKTKEMISNPGYVLSSLYWAEDGQSLYFLKHKSMDTSVSGYAFETWAYQIPLQTKKIEKLGFIQSETNVIPIENFAMRNINLYLEGKRLSFYKNGISEVLTSRRDSKKTTDKNHYYINVNTMRGDSDQFAFPVLEDIFSVKDSDQLMLYNSMVSPTGKYLGIDNNDHLYYVHNQWFHKRLFKLSRHENDNNVPKYLQPKVRELNIKHINWTPKGKYVLMEHRTLGILILDPLSSRIGVIGKNGNAYGWYEPPRT